MNELLLSIPEAARRICLSKSKMWDLVGKGAVASVTIGGSERRVGRRLIHVDALEAYAQGLIEESTTKR